MHSEPGDRSSIWGRICAHRQITACKSRLRPKQILFDETLDSRVATRGETLSLSRSPFAPHLQMLFKCSLASFDRIERRTTLANPFLVICVTPSMWKASLSVHSYGLRDMSRFGSDMRVDKKRCALRRLRFDARRLNERDKIISGAIQVLSLARETYDLRSLKHFAETRLQDSHSQSSRP